MADYDDEERAYADWLHRFVGRLKQCVPAQAFARVLPIAAHWVRHARHMAPEEAADVAALWCGDGAGSDAAGESAGVLADVEFEHLCAVEQRICDTLAHIAEQEQVVVRLREGGCRDGEALELLAGLQAALDALTDARATVLLRWGHPSAPICAVGSATPRP
jgi:hypothetical protein